MQRERGERGEGERNGGLKGKERTILLHNYNYASLYSECETIAYNFRRERRKVNYKALLEEKLPKVTGGRVLRQTAADAELYAERGERRPWE